MASPLDQTPPALGVLLPERRRFAGQPVGVETGKFLARADRLADGEPGERAQLLRHFDLLPRGWPMAAITRQRDAGDAVLHQWLRADPAHVRPDMTGARVLANCPTSMVDTPMYRALPERTMSFSAPMVSSTGVFTSK